MAMAAVGSRGGGRQGWETEVAGAVAAVPEIFELIREMELSPDDDCYATAMRYGGGVGMALLCLSVWVMCRFGLGLCRFWLSFVSVRFAVVAVVAVP